MKTNFSQTLLVLLIAQVFFLVACSGEKKTKMDTAAFDKAFQGAPAEIQTQATIASKAFKEGRYAEGGSALEAIAKKAGKELSEEQKNGIYDLVSKAQSIMAENAEKSDMKAYQAFENATAAMDGRPPVQVGFTPTTPADAPPE